MCISLGASKEAAAKIAPGAPLMFWRMIPKHHLVLHVCEDQVLAMDNPRDIWCYGDEHQIGRAATVASELHPRTVSKIIMERYRALEFER